MRRGWLKFGLWVALGGWAATSMAQQRDYEQGKGWTLGVTGGATACKVNFLPDMDSKMKTGALAGVAARYVSEKHLGLQMEFGYVGRGWREKSERYRYERRMNYLELPVLTHIYFGRKVQFFVHIGPKIALLLSESGSLRPGERYTARTQHGKDADHRFDYSLVGGLGVEMRSGRVRYGIEGRYNYGMGDIFTNGTAANFERSSHQYFQVAGHVGLDFARKERDRDLVPVVVRDNEKERKAKAERKAARRAEKEALKQAPDNVRQAE